MGISQICIIDENKYIHLMGLFASYMHIYRTFILGWTHSLAWIITMISKRNNDKFLALVVETISCLIKLILNVSKAKLRLEVI